MVWQNGLIRKEINIKALFKMDIGMERAPFILHQVLNIKDIGKKAWLKAKENLNQKINKIILANFKKDTSMDKDN